MAENTINNLSIQVTASAENAARVFDRLASSAGRLRGAAQGASGGLHEVGEAAKNFCNTTENAGKASEKVFFSTSSTFTFSIDAILSL